MVRQPVPSPAELHVESRKAHLQGGCRGAVKPRYFTLRDQPQWPIPVWRRRGVFAGCHPFPQRRTQHSGGRSSARRADRPAPRAAKKIQVGDPLPDALTGLLTASAFTYTTAVAPLLFAQGDRIGDAAIHRDAYNAYFQDSWKVSDRLLLNYGLRYEIDSPIREPAKRTSA